MEEIIVEETCRKCGSPEKIWDDNKGRYNCAQCGKKRRKVQKTGYTDNKKVLSWWQIRKKVKRFLDEFN
jgi:uncharacterized Zn finger protein (UPF0148 family)